MSRRKRFVGFGLALVCLVAAPLASPATPIELDPGSAERSLGDPEIAGRGWGTKGYSFLSGDCTGNEGSCPYGFD